MLNIAVARKGNVEPLIAILLSQNHKVIAVDVVESKLEMSKQQLDAKTAYFSADFVVINVHTNNKTVWEHLQDFTTFNRFSNSPVACFKGELYSMPFNMHIFNEM